MFIFSIFILILLAADLSLLLKRNIAVTLPVSCFLIILGMYLFSLVNLLGAAVWGVGLLVVSFTCLTGWKTLGSQGQARALLLEYVWTPAFIVFLVFTVLLFFLSYDVHVFQWDEYSHWSTTVKDMYFTDRLSIYKDVSTTGFVSYPPAMALWQYFFVKLCGRWTDGIIIFAYNLYLLMMMMPVVGKLKWKHWPLVLVFFLLMYVMPYWFYTPYEGSAWRCVYIDRAISFTFTYLMVSYFTSNQIDPLSLGLGMFVLPLLKSIGLAFCAFAAFAIVMDFMAVNKENRKRNLFLVLCCLVVCIAGYYSWKMRLWFAGTGGVWNTSRLTLKSVVKLFLGMEEEWKYHVAKSFWLYLFNNGLQHFHGSIIITIAGFPAFWALALLFGMVISKKERLLKRNLFLAGVFAVEFVLYEFSILLTQLYLLSQTEAAVLSGLMRYSSNFALGASCFIMIYLFSIVVDNLKEREMSYHVGIVSGLVLFTICTVPNTQVLSDLWNHDKAVENSYMLTGFTPYLGLEEEFFPILTKEDNVYLVASGYGYHVLRKLMIPARSGPFWVDSLTQEDTIDSWREKLVDGNYNYVYIDEITDGFVERFQSCFENGVVESQSLYQVTAKDGLHLVKVFGKGV